MYGNPGLLHDAEQVQRLLVMQRLVQQHRQQQQQLLLQQQQHAIQKQQQPLLQVLAVPVIAPIVPPFSQPLTLADLKPSVLLVFQRLIQEHLTQYRQAIQSKDPLRAQTTIASVYDALLSACAPLKNLIQGLPPRDRIEGLILSSFDLLVAGHGKADNQRQDIESKTISNDSGNDSSKVEGSAVPKDTISDSVGIPKGMTINLHAKRAYRKAVTMQILDQQKIEAKQKQQAKLNANNRQDYQQESHHGAVSQKECKQLDTLNNQGSEGAMLQQRQLDHQKMLCVHIISLLKHQQAEATALLNLQTLDPVTRSRVASGLVERQRLMDVQSAHLDTLIKLDQQFSATTNRTPQHLSDTKPPVSISDKITTTPKESKALSKGEFTSKLSGTASSKCKSKEDTKGKETTINAYGRQKAPEKESSEKDNIRSKRKRPMILPIPRSRKSKPDLPKSSSVVDIANKIDKNPSSKINRENGKAVKWKRTTKRVGTLPMRRGKLSENCKTTKNVFSPEVGEASRRSDGPIPDYLPPSSKRALKLLAPHNAPGNTTAGDNAFIIDTALNLLPPRHRKRRRRNIDYSGQC